MSLGRVHPIATRAGCWRAIGSLWSPTSRSITGRRSLANSTPSSRRPVQDCRSSFSQESRPTGHGSIRGTSNSITSSSRASTSVAVIGHDDLPPVGYAPPWIDTNPTIVLSAGFSPLVSGRIARWCSRRPDVAFGVWSGEISSTPTARARIRRRQRRALLRRADFAVAYGWSSARYLRTLAPELPIVIGRNTTPAPASRVSERDSTDVELLVVSRAVPRKRIDLVVDAVRQLALPNLRLTVIGDGPELPNLEASSGSANIRFRGALSPREVRESYTRADILRLPVGVRRLWPCARGGDGGRTGRRHVYGARCRRRSRR